MNSLSLTRPDVSTFRPIGAVIAALARRWPDKAAIVCNGAVMTWRVLAARMDSIAFMLQRVGVGLGDRVAVLLPTTGDGVAGFLAPIRAGACVVPLSVTITPRQLRMMLEDCDARAVIATSQHIALVDAALSESEALQSTARLVLGPAAGAWIDADMNSNVDFTPPPIGPWVAFNIVYSSGTTGVPKGIVHDHAARWYQSVPSRDTDIEPDAVVLISTPLSSNTTIGVLLRGVCTGATMVLMPKFDPGEFLALCESEHVTQATLVPVQCQRLLAHPDFVRSDLSRVALRCTGAPASASLKQQLLERWRGPVTDSYGFTELAVGCVLDLRAFPEKLHTVGRPRPEVDMRIVGADGREAAIGQPGELVGRAPTMMNGYHKLPEATRELAWVDANGRTFYRAGDLAVVDEDGFVTLLGRSRDMIISGGLNIYPSDLEEVLASHPDVAEAAVVGIPSPQWGETPLGLVVLHEAAQLSPEALRDWANARLAKTQRLSGIEFRDHFPRNEIGKVLKTTLRSPYWPGEH